MFLFKYSTLGFSDWGLIEIDKWVGVFGDFRRVNFVDGLGPLVEGLGVVFFGDEHDEFI